jgi:hypothetical protein
VVDVVERGHEVAGGDDARASSVPKVDGRPGTAPGDPEARARRVQTRLGDGDPQD